MNSVITLSFLTGNAKKIDTANKVLFQFNINVVGIKTNYIDFNCSEIEKSIEHGLLLAADSIEGYIIASKVGYFIDSLNGFPGFHSDYVNNTLSAEQILKMMSGVNNRHFKVKTCLGLYDYKSNTCVYFYSEKSGIISKKPEGVGTTLDRIMIRDGQSKVQSLYDYDEMIEYYSRNSHYRKLAEYILSH
jgi:non-canonical purine NTP pyrophosphatase (RdgB/HAM1 family)